MATFLYYFILLPLSKLPLSVLYGISDLLFFFGYRLVGYRKKIVRGNIARSFPEWPSAQVNQQVAKFYAYFFDTLVESIKLFSISDEEALQRCPVTNPELVEPYAAAGQDVLLVGAHYANWEVAALSFPLIFPAQTVVGIYSPLGSQAMDDLVRKNRQRTGVHLISRRKVNEYYEERPVSPSLDFFVADQSPSNHVWQKVHWTNFLNQPTGFVAGPERFAVRNNMPVFYMTLRLKKRGYYEATLVPITDDPLASKPGDITEAFARILEKEIFRDPTPWLWTHRRWKREAPQEVITKLAEQTYVAPQYDRNIS